MKRLIIILVILLCTNLLSSTIQQKAEEAIDLAEKTIQDTAKDIPIQYQFDPEVRRRMGEAGNILAAAKKQYQAKYFSGAIINAQVAEELSIEATVISTVLVNKMEAEIADKINSLKKRNNDAIAKEMIFETENYFQQKNYYACMKRIEKIKDYKSISKSKRKVIKKTVKTSKKLKKKTTYIVKIGDSLWKIAKKKYKNPMKWVVIYKANKIKNMNLIYPGQILILPGK